MIRQEEVPLAAILQSDYVFFLKGQSTKEEVVKLLTDGLYPQVKDFNLPGPLLKDHGSGEA